MRYKCEIFNGPIDLVKDQLNKFLMTLQYPCSMNVSHSVDWAIDANKADKICVTIIYREEEK